MAVSSGGGRVPVFARWRDSAGATVDVLLHWHPGLPASLPEGADEALCVVQLCAASPLPECLEARLQRKHLHGDPARWPPDRLTRLMAAMARPGSPGGERDSVSLRRETGRMVIDVVFAAGGAGGPACAAAGRVVEILNAYPPGTSLRGSVTGMLRSVVGAQRAHRRRIAEAQADLSELRSGLSRLEGRWSGACQDARRRCRERLRRFALLLQAKIDKETELHAEAEERYWAERNQGTASERPASGPGAPPRDGGQLQASERPAEAPSRGAERVCPPAKRRRGPPPVAEAAVTAAAAAGRAPRKQERHPEAPAAAQAPRPALVASPEPAAIAALSLLDPASSGDEAPAPRAASIPRAPAAARAEPVGADGPGGQTYFQSALAGSLFQSDEE